MMQFIKKNFVLVLAFFLPISFLLIIAATIYIPSLYLSTDYNFIYAACDKNLGYDPGCKEYLNQRFTVENNKLNINDLSQEVENNETTSYYKNNSYTAHIFYYDTETNESREITVQDAQQYKLNKLLTSPDGITITDQYSRSPGVFPFFDGGSSYGYYLSKGNTKKKINTVANSSRSYYADSFKFIGWIIQ